MAPNFFVQYQTVIVGVLGFVGVMVTLWWNARLARVARKEATEHDRAVLRTALIQELKAIKSSFESRSETAADMLLRKHRRIGSQSRNIP